MAVHRQFDTFYADVRGLSCVCKYMMVKNKTKDFITDAKY